MQLRTNVLLAALTAWIGITACEVDVGGPIETEPCVDVRGDPNCGFGTVCSEETGMCEDATLITWCTVALTIHTDPAPKPLSLERGATGVAFELLVTTTMDTAFDAIAIDYTPRLFSAFTVRDGLGNVLGHAPSAQDNATAVALSHALLAGGSTTLRVEATVARDTEFDSGEIWLRQPAAHVLDDTQRVCTAGWTIPIRRVRITEATTRPDPSCTQDNEITWSLPPVLDGQRGRPGSEAVIATIATTALVDLEIFEINATIPRASGLRLTIDGAEPISGGTFPNGDTLLMYSVNAELRAGEQHLPLLQAQIEETAQPGFVTIGVTVLGRRLSDGGKACTTQLPQSISFEILPSLDPTFPPGHPCLDYPEGQRPPMLFLPGSQDSIHHEAPKVNANMAGFRAVACTNAEIIAVNADVRALGSSLPESPYAGLRGPDTWNIAPFTLAISGLAYLPTYPVAAEEWSEDVHVKIVFGFEHLIEFVRGYEATIEVHGDAGLLPHGFLNSYLTSLDAVEVLDRDTGLISFAAILADPKGSNFVGL